MDQSIQYATESFLRDELAKATLRISSLEESYARAHEMSNTNWLAAQTLMETMQEWTLEAINSGTLNESEAEEIAEIVGFELSKEFEVEVTVLYSLTVNARDEESAQNAIHDIDFDSVSYGQEVTYLSSSVDRIDI